MKKIIIGSIGFISSAMVSTLEIKEVMEALTQLIIAIVTIASLVYNNKKEK